MNKKPLSITYLHQLKILFVLQKKPKTLNIMNYVLFSRVLFLNSDKV